jgi:TonB family protein
MMDSGEYASAREVLVSVGDADGDLRTEFDAKLGAARCLLSLGRAEQALSEFETLSRQERFYGRSGEAEVWVGRALSAAGRNDEAAEAFESVADEHPGTREAGEALVALGDLCRDVLGDLDRAAESYGRVKNTSGVPDSLSLRAQESAAEIARLQAFWEALADSARAEQAATDRFRLAETYLYDFGWSDSARHEFITLVEDQPESPLAPRALLSVAGIDTETGDTTSALTLHRRIVQEYPRSDEAGDAWLLLPPDERPVRYDAGDLYDAAVELYTLEDYNSVREYCDSLVAQYPGSRYVVKALFLSARAAERIFGGADSTAFLAYTEIASEHPWTPEGKLASAFIGRDTLVSVGRGREVLSDSLLVVLDSTGRGQSKSAFPNAPPVTDYGELRMPDVEGLRYSNVVTLKIIIDAFGHVTAAEIIGSSGERDVDDAVVEAVLATVFNVKEKQPEDLQTWFTFRVDIDEYLDIQQKTRD